jgi:hypothetical protein
MLPFDVSGFKRGDGLKYAAHLKDLVLNIQADVALIAACQQGDAGAVVVL